MPDHPTAIPASRRVLVVAALLSLAALACICGGVGLIPIRAGGAAPTAASQPTLSRPEPTASPEPAAPTAGPVPTKTPLPVPLASDFTLTTFHGGTFTLSDYRGQVVVINFWASWCPPCVEEIPNFQQAWEVYEGMGVQFIGIAVDDNDIDSIRLLADLDVTYPNGADPGNSISADYRAWALPKTVIIAPSGAIAQTWLGVVTYEQLNDALAELVTEG
jgi:peroxiredoxin